MDIDNIKIEQNDDLIFLTVGKYKLFIKHKDEGGLDAMVLFNHYMFTARLQHTNSVKANDQYVRNALGFGIVKLKRAKALLRKFNLIEYKQERNEDGTMKDQYINLKISSSIPEDKNCTTGTNIVPVVQSTAPPVDRPTGGEKQMLEQESKCLNKKENLTKEIYKRIIDGFYQYHNKQYKIDGKERGTAKRLAEILVEDDDWEFTLKNKILGLQRKIKENSRFWAFTIPKLEYGWNEFSIAQSTEEDASFINEMDMRKIK